MSDEKKNNNVATYILGGGISFLLIGAIAAIKLDNDIRSKDFLDTKNTHISKTDEMRVVNPNFLIGLCQVGSNGTEKSQAAANVVGDCSLTEFAKYDAVLIGQKFYNSKMSIVISVNLSEVPEDKRLFKVIDVSTAYDINADGTILVSSTAENGCILRTVYKKMGSQISEYSLPLEGSCDEMQRQVNIAKLNSQSETANKFRAVSMIKYTE